MSKCYLESSEEGDEYLGNLWGSSFPLGMFIGTITVTGVSMFANAEDRLLSWCLWLMAEVAEVTEIVCVNIQILHLLRKCPRAPLRHSVRRQDSVQ